MAERSGSGQDTAMPHPDLADLAERWLVHLRAERKSPATLRIYRAGVRAYLAWCANNDQPAILDVGRGSSLHRPGSQPEAHDPEAAPPAASGRLRTGQRRHRVWQQDRGKRRRGPDPGTPRWWWSPWRRFHAQLRQLERRMDEPRDDLGRERTARGRGDRSPRALAAAGTAVTPERNHGLAPRPHDGQETGDGSTVDSLGRRRRVRVRPCAQHLWHVHVSSVHVRGPGNCAAPLGFAVG